MRKHNDYCIILAGGIGRRLWPCSRKDMPKQFIDFFGTGQTLLQQTYARFVRFIPAERIIISTFEDYRETVARQLPEVPAENILAEPVQLSTAPAVAWASIHIEQRDPEANVVVVPSDHHIVDEERFVRQIGDGLDFVECHDDFLAMGIKATVPNSAYGYIQTGSASDDGCRWRVKSFTEKPQPEYARVFVESGEFLWNTGIFLWNCRTMDCLLRQMAPMLLERIGSAHAEGLTPAEKLHLIQTLYPASMHSTVDLVILNRREDVFVQECDFGWSDVGCWPEIYKVSEQDGDGNVRLNGSRVMFSGCRDNLVRLPRNVAAVVKNLEGYVVALDGNALLICPNDDPSLVRRLVNEAQMKLGDEFV